MKMFTVTGPKISFNAGIILILTIAQAMARQHALKPVKGKKDQYEVMEPIMFKHGEEIGITGLLDKNQERNLTLTEELNKAVVDKNKKDPDSGKTQKTKPEEDPEQSGLDDASNEELVEIAEMLEIEGAKGMKRDELLAVLKEKEQETA